MLEVAVTSGVFGRVKVAIVGESCTAPRDETGLYERGWRGDDNGI